MRKAGFTLIEVIITIVVVAVLASMVYTYFGAAITDSSTPVTRLEAALNAQSAMENVTADYKAYYVSDLAGLQGKIGAEGSPLNPSYGQGTVVDNHFITWSGGAGVRVPSPAVSNCLEVTVRDNTGDVLTQIYTSGNQTPSCQ